MSTACILVLGDVMRDIVVHVHGPVRPGTDQRAAIATMPGGAAANAAAWLAHAGARARLLACVGREDVDAERHRLADRGIEAVLVGHPGLRTGTLVALVGADGERSFLTDRGANDGLVLDTCWDGLFADVTHVHVSGYAFVGEATRVAALRVVAAARAAGLLVSVDPGSAGFIADLGPEAVLGWSAGATLCVANEAEAEALTGMAEPAAQLSRLVKRFDLAVLKRGPRGAMARHRDGRRWEQPAPGVAVLDTIGAGDAFLAGFLAAAALGEAVETCLAAAVALGSLAVTLRGGQPPRDGLTSGRHQPAFQHVAMSEEQR